MSGLTPSKIRSKTSEFTEFFRARDSANQAKFPSNDVSTQSQATTYTLDAPSTSTSADGVVKKKSTRIPFLGRQRKKSNPNQSATERESTDVGEHWKDGRPTVEIAEPLPQLRPAPIAAPSPVRQSTSLGSKLAATFNPRARKLSAVGPQPPLPSTSKADTLSPPTTTNARGASLDSSRSLTPQPAQPTITISPTPDDLSEFKDLFTVHSKFKAKPAEDNALRESNTNSSYPTPSASPAASPQIPTTPETVQRIPRRGSEPAVRESSRQKVPKSQRPASSTSKYSKVSRRASPTEKENSSSSSSTPRNSEGKDSRRSSDDKVVGPPVQRRASGLPTTPAAEYSAQQRLRLRQMSPTADKRNRPPSIPLPQAPSSPSSPSPPPSSTDVTNSAASSTPRVRSRAGTVSSVTSIPPSPLSQSTVPRDSQGDVTPRAEPASFDIDSATTEELREALRSRDRQCDELAGSLAKIMKDHAAEKAALDQKVSQLEKDMSKKDNQIKGLMWLVAHNKNPPATDFPAKYELPALPSRDDTGSISSKFSGGRLPTRRSQLSDDSGAEYLTSGAESPRSGSELSGNESSSRHRKIRRPYTLGESSQHLYRTVTSKRAPPPNSALPELPVGAAKRSSISSASLSPASSTSSLLPPSPSVTVSSLSSIPEAPSLRYATKLGASDVVYQEDRQIRAANRMSTSSMASSSTAASSAYASNLKRSRPPSIAQVLDHLPQRG
ncbi:hypothetical protein BKA70DRAFT_92388 [Coprinopsis sp. MPI-PUGE-AT-0042]|nr:hypothetical protein BKA70DRAFT_92388 [Coprinopsis sp. MPI-PUGE-AT-0042]